MDANTAFSLLGLVGTGTSQQSSPIQNVIDQQYKNPNTVFRITSVGKSGNVTRSVEMVVLKQAAGVGRPQVFSWKEL
jgi:hypothetical protein